MQINLFYIYYDYDDKKQLFVTCAADITEVTGKEQTAQPAKRGRGRKQ